MVGWGNRDGERDGDGDGDGDGGDGGMGMGMGMAVAVAVGRVLDKADDDGVNQKTLWSQGPSHSF